MIEIKVIMNSNVEEVFAFKCCRIPDQNLEIQIKNSGPDPVKLHSYCDFIDAEGKATRINYLFPHGILTIQPRDMGGFYCSADDDFLTRFKEIALYDEQGNSYRAAV